MKKKVTTKIYQSIKTLFYATNIVVGKGDVRRISFDGGLRTPRIVNGKFSTSDVALQQAMEKDAAFNVKYKLAGTIATEVDVPTVKAPVQEEQEDIQMQITTEVKEFPTGAAAKDWMMKELGFPSAVLRNKPTMVELAKEKGYVLVFEND